MAGLQWSHASSRVETRLSATEETRAHASMEPRVFTRGNKCLGHIGLPKLKASMEPRVFTRGNAWPQLLWVREDMLQWSHASSRVETWWMYLGIWSRRRGFNGATRLHAWKRSLMAPR